MCLIGCMHLTHESLSSHQTLICEQEGEYDVTSQWTTSSDLNIPRARIMDYATKMCGSMNEVMMWAFSFQLC